jgi:hypothetical protein
MRRLDAELHDFVKQHIRNRMIPGWLGGGAVYSLEGVDPNAPRPRCGHPDHIEAHHACRAIDRRAGGDWLHVPLKGPARLIASRVQPLGPGSPNQWPPCTFTIRHATGGGQLDSEYLRWLEAINARDGVLYPSYMVQTYVHADSSARGGYTLDAVGMVAVPDLIRLVGSPPIDGSLRIQSVPVQGGNWMKVVGWHELAKHVQIWTHPSLDTLEPWGSQRAA